MSRRSTLVGSILAATAMVGGGIAAGPAASAAEAPQSVQRASSSSNIPCGFGMTTQSYKNCTGKPIMVVARAHESATGKVFYFNYCLDHLDVQKPLNMPGMWVWVATHTEVKRQQC